MQHTPKPSAQVPSFVPPMLEHSALKINKLIFAHDMQNN